MDSEPPGATWHDGLAQARRKAASHQSGSGAPAPGKNASPPLAPCDAAATASSRALAKNRGTEEPRKGIQTPSHRVHSVSFRRGGPRGLNLDLLEPLPWELSGYASGDQRWARGGSGGPPHSRKKTYDGVYRKCGIMCIEKRQK